MSRKVAKFHELSLESKNLFRICRTWFIVTFARRIQKSKPFCNLNPCKSTTERVRSTPGYKVKFSNWYFSSLILGFHKCHFSVRCLDMLKIAVRKKMPSTESAWGYMIAKNDISTWNLACQMYTHSSSTHSVFFLILDFEKRYIKNFRF